MGLSHGKENIYEKYGQPTLDLVFTGPKKSLTDRVGNKTVEFTRSSTATYVGSDGLIKTAAVDEARFDHDPATGESLGLLIEEGRTNFRTYSRITASTYTSFSNKATIVPSTEVSPDGTISGVQISNNTGADDQYCWGYFTDYVTVPTTGYICASIFVKMIAGTQIRVQGDVANQGWVGFAGVVVDFSTATPTITLAGASGQNAIGGGAIPYPNGWWRIWYYIDTADGFNNGQTRSVGVVPQINGTSACIWGAQIETGSFPTSYIPTSGSTASRASDVAEVTGPNWLNTWSTTGSGNSIYAEGSINYTTDAPYPGGPMLYTMDGFSSGVTKVWYSLLEADRGPIDGVSGGGGSVELFHYTVTSRGPGTFKSCMTFDVPNNRLQSAWNTVLSGSGSNAAFFNDMWTVGSNPRLTIGGKDIGSDRRAWCGCIKRITVYNAGFTNAQLLALTT